ncbi:MAG: hypothetical protein ACFE8N_12875 [Promethearchaeota archaeon]
MTQIILKEGTQVEVEELFIVLREKSEPEEKNNEDMWRQYHLLENMNPRYQEETMTMKDAKAKIAMSDIIAIAKFNPNGMY